MKAFNTLHYKALGARGAKQGERLALFVAGDDTAAKQTVSQLITEMGFEPIDTGSLAVGGSLQAAGSPIYNRELTAAQAKKLLAETPH